VKKRGGIGTGRGDQLPGKAGQSNRGNIVNPLTGRKEGKSPRPPKGEKKTQRGKGYGEIGDKRPPERNRQNLPPNLRSKPESSQGKKGE